MNKLKNILLAVKNALMLTTTSKLEREKPMLEILLKKQEREYKKWLEDYTVGDVMNPPVAIHLSVVLDHIDSNRMELHKKLIA